MYPMALNFSMIFFDIFLSRNMSISACGTSILPMLSCSLTLNCRILGFIRNSSALATRETFSLVICVPQENLDDKQGRGGSHVGRFISLDDDLMSSFVKLAYLSGLLTRMHL